MAPEIHMGRLQEVPLYHLVEVGDITIPQDHRGGANPIRVDHEDHKGLKGTQEVLTKTTIT